MQVTTVISLLAVGVSVASVIANLYVARLSRRTNLEVLRFKAALDRIDASAKLMKELEAESELLRIRGWELLSQIQREHRQPGGSDYHSLLKRLIDFSKQADVFLDKWATTKGEFSEEQSLRLRKLRHECRAEINRIVARLSMLGRPASPERISRELKGIESDVQLVLSLVQGFIVDVTNARKAMWADSGY